MYSNNFHYPYFTFLSGWPSLVPPGNLDDPSSLSHMWTLHPSPSPSTVLRSWRNCQSRHGETSLSVAQWGCLQHELPNFSTSTPLYHACLIGFFGIYVTLDEETKHNACAGYQSETEAKRVARSDNYRFSLFWDRSIEESFLYTTIYFVASRALYLPSYGSKKSAV